MNTATVSALVIRLFSAYQLFYACQDAFYLLAKQATDPHFDLYHFTACMMFVRTFLAVIMYLLAIPLGKRIAKGLFEPAP
jgi:hypothetical protein